MKWCCWKNVNCEIYVNYSISCKTNINRFIIIIIISAGAADAAAIRASCIIQSSNPVPNPKPKPNYNKTFVRLWERKKEEKRKQNTKRSCRKEASHIMYVWVCWGFQVEVGERSRRRRRRHRQSSREYTKHARRAVTQ